MDKQQALPEIALSVGAPAVLAVVELFHPHPHDLLKLDVQTWLLVHYAQILLFPLSALAFTMLVRKHGDAAAILCRISMFVFAITYTAFDTAAGVVTGILVKAANASGTPDAWRAAIDAVWTIRLLAARRSAPRFWPCSEVLRCRLAQWRLQYHLNGRAAHGLLWCCWRYPALELSFLRLTHGRVDH